MSRPAEGTASAVGARPVRSQGDEARTRLLVIGTGLRILLTPVVMALVLAGSDTAAVIVFIAAAATDWFDGRLARRWEVTTRLGAFLDTTADKLLVTGVLVALVAVDRASPWLAMVIIGRELILLGLRAAVEPPRAGTSRPPCSASGRPPSSSSRSPSRSCGRT